MLIGILLFIVLNDAQAGLCPENYIDLSPEKELGWGCYKIFAASNVTWFEARQLCLNDSIEAPKSAHLIALEHRNEYLAVVDFLKSK